MSNDIIGNEVTGNTEFGIAVRTDSSGKLPRVFSYILTHDGGFAPNPFWGACTLACCKPDIRRVAKRGDWIVGLRGISLYTRAVGTPSVDPEEIFRVVFAMRVERTTTFAEYFRDPNFESKRPDRTTREIVHRVGDNIYEPLVREPKSTEDYRQLPSEHSRKDGSPDEGRKSHDLGGRNVLVATSAEFSYFGRRPEPLPKPLQRMIFQGALRGLRRLPNIKDPRDAADVIDFLSGLPRGVQAAPHKWRDGDDSWKS